MFYLRHTAYFTGAGIAGMYIASFFFFPLYPIATVLLLVWVIAILLDTLLLFGRKKGITASRNTTERMSLGDDNPVQIQVFNHYTFPAHITVIDEIPMQFQARSWKQDRTIARAGIDTINYTLKPLTRGIYQFNNLNVFVKGPLRLCQRRYTFPAPVDIKVYPSFIQLRRFHFLAVGNRLQEAGVKRIRRLGHSMEFEQIKEYVRGDDYRTINWKATSRKGGLMVNNYTDEKSQQVYCLINKGRVMKMPFDGMTLLDHAINATLVLSNIALVKQDKAGLITFAEKIDTVLPADKKPGQMNILQEALYRQQTNFLEADYEKLYGTIRNRITNRSLLLLFTNFESLESLQRELPALKRIAHYHLLVVIIFENTAIKSLLASKATSLEAVYIKTIAEKFAFEKRQMIKELQQNGIIGLLTAPEQLTVNTINKYLELKNRGLG